MATSKKTEAKPSLTVEEEAEFIRNAPISEVAEYLHTDIDLAVQLRIDQAVSDTYDNVAAKRGPIAEDLYRKWASEQKNGKMSIEIRPIEPKGNLYGFACVTVGGIRIDDFKIVKNKEGEFFIGMPSKPDKTSNTGYRNTVHIDKGFKASFDEEVLKKYHAAVEHSKEHLSNYRIASEKPARIAEQYEKAEKTVKQQNAELLPKEKADMTRSERDK